MILWTFGDVIHLPVLFTPGDEKKVLPGDSGVLVKFLLPETALGENFSKKVVVPGKAVRGDNLVHVRSIRCDVAELGGSYWTEGRILFRDDTCAKTLTKKKKRISLDDAPENPFYISLTEHLGDGDTKLEIRGNGLYTPSSVDGAGNNNDKDNAAKKKKPETRYFMIAVCVVKPITLDQLLEQIVKNARGEQLKEKPEKRILAFLKRQEEMEDDECCISDRQDQTKKGHRLSLQCCLSGDYMSIPVYGRHCSGKHLDCCDLVSVLQTSKVFCFVGDYMIPVFSSLGMYQYH